MDANDPASLDRLHDIFVPPPVPWWPPAPGWYLLAALTVLLLTLLIARQVMRWRADAYRRAAIAKLNLLLTGGVVGATAASKLHEAAEILKRTALAAAPRGEVAGLSGGSWISWLNQYGGGTVFDGDDARLLADNVYRRATRDGVSAEQLYHLTDQVRAWIVSHRIASSEHDAREAA